MGQKPVHENPSSSSIAISAGIKKPTIQEKKAALRELSDGTKSPDAPVLSKDKIGASDSSANKLAGTKRPNPSSPASPLTFTYVRRRLEAEQPKATSSPVPKDVTTKEQNARNSQEAQVVQNLQNSQQTQDLHILNDSQNLQNLYKGEVAEAARLQNVSTLGVCKATKFQNGSHDEVGKISKLQNEEVCETSKQQHIPKGEASEATKLQIGSKCEIREATKLQNGTKGEATEAGKFISSLTESQDWKDRFFRLQTYLRNCDQSNQEDYKRRLRSLSADDRSKHAVDLEKRAIHLLLEEGKELHRMKVLNVLGKGPTSDPSLYSSELSPSPTRPQPLR